MNQRLAPECPLWVFRRFLFGEKMDELTDHEKLIESLNSIATVLGEYKKALIAQGFDQDEAFALVLDYQEILMTTPSPKGNGDGG